MIRLGLTVLLEDNIELVEDKAIGLITNSTGVNEHLDANILLLNHRGIKLKAIFSPEHGLWGAVQDAISIPSFHHEKVNIPVHSLYGTSKKPTKEMLKGIDALIFDVQDVGSRFYTYISTMAMAMEACAENNVEFIVLDRPNPINGVTIEGNILDLEFRSFVGYYPIPIRHGMTVCELALLFNSQFNIGTRLHTVKMDGWSRDMWFDDTGLHWVMPSPNMPGLDTAVVYPGMCLFEGTNLSEGRGTTKPFEIIGAPWINAFDLSFELNRMSLAGAKFRPLNFIPTFAKYKDEQCGGVQVHVMDRNEFGPVETAINMIRTIIRMYPKEFQWIGNNRPFFDLLMGTDKVRKSLINSGILDNNKISGFWEDDLRHFSETRSKCLLY